MARNGTELGPLGRAKMKSLIGSYLLYSIKFALLDFNKVLDLFGHS